MSSRGDCWTCSSFEKMRKHVIAIASLHASPTPSHPSGKPTAVPSSGQPTAAPRDYYIAFK